MQVLPLILVALVDHGEGYTAIPGTSLGHHQPVFICATFPFCYQDQDAIWRSLPQISPSSFQRDVAVESSECSMKGYFCRSDASNLIEAFDSESADDCQGKCEEKEGCAHFSFHITRGQGQCSLLSSCKVITECLDRAAYLYRVYVRVT